MWLHQCRKMTLVFSLLFWYSDIQTNSHTESKVAADQPLTQYVTLISQPNIDHHGQFYQQYPTLVLCLFHNQITSLNWQGEAFSECLFGDGMTYLLPTVPPNQHESVRQHYVTVTHITHQASIVSTVTVSCVQYSPDSHYSVMVIRYNSLVIYQLHHNFNWSLSSIINW